MSDLKNLSKLELLKEVEKLRKELHDKKSKANIIEGTVKEGYWEKFFNALSSITMLVDKKGIIKNCNKAARKYFKLSKNQIVDNNFWKILSGSDQLQKEIEFHAEKRQFKEIKVANKWFRITIEPVFESTCNFLMNVVSISDITERKNYITDIENKGNKFADLVELANIAIASDDKDGNLIYFNKQFADLFGYSIEEIKNLSHRDLIHPADLKNVTEIHKSRFGKANVTSRYEFRGIRKDGKTIYVDIAVSDRIKTDGKVVGTRSYLRDITEKKINEWKSNEQVKKLKCLHNIANISSQKDITIDEFFTKLITLLPEAIQDPPNSVCLIKYNDKAYQSENFKRTTNSIGIDIKLKKKTVGRIEIYHLGKTIDKGKLEFTDEEKELLKTVSFKVSDFLEYMHAELIQKILFDIANAVITSENVEGLISFIRDQLGLLLDTTNFYVAFYNKATNMLHCPYMFDERDTLESWPADRSMTGYMIRQKRPVLLKKKDYLKLSLHGEFDIIGDISEVWLGVPLVVRNEVIGGFVVQSYNNPDAYDEGDMEVLEFVSHQISISIERKKAIEDLEKALDKAQESDHLKSAFLTNMSHEIRTPLNGILGFTKLLTKDTLHADKKKKYVEIIDRNSRQLINIIGDILEISKIETGQIEAYNQRLNLFEFINGIYEFYKPTFKSKNLEFTLNLNFTDKTIEIITDEGKLNQIISNLLSNALKFTKEGVVELGCILRQGNLKFYIRDTGIGIDKSIHDKIFDRFRQAELKISRNYEGNGLGLAITKGFVELLGGDIWIESELGKGATFNFTIQLNIFKQKENDIGVTSDELELSSKRQYRILVVDDDEESRLYLSEVLSKYKNYKVISLSSGHEAVDYVKNNMDTDIALLDIKMPDLDGYDTARRIKSVNSDLTLIAQTAYAFYNDKQKAFDAGFDDYIAKPILPEKLIKLLQKYTVR